ncbi:MAG TPA: glycosyltransferase [Ignavibacteriaceae bacterium]|nr:glycosyltransferase [Ignavibacteriaceae bacterium]
MLEIIFLVALSGYFIQSVLFIIGSSRTFPKNNSADLPFTTVIVAARNEEKNILRCLSSLEKIDYPEGKLEIILVDDKSSDETGKIIDEFICGKQKFKKIVTKKEIGRLKGKTNALANALDLASGEIILTTDADCTLPASWVKTTVSYYTKNVAAVTGFTTQVVNDNFSGMQAIDFIYLLFVASGTINLGVPISCIGNNMSYRKSAYNEVGGYENLPFSVTEDFNLLNAIRKLGRYKIIAPLDKDALVTTLPCRSLKDLFRQKKRWAVGGISVPLPGYLLFIFGFLTNFCVFISPLLLFNFFNVLTTATTWIYLVFFKLAIDFFILQPIHARLGIVKNLKYFAAFELYYIIYVTAIPFVLFTNRRVIWKGRKY